MALSKEEMGVPHPDLNALAAFIDRRLTDTERAAVARHLGGCLECRTILATQARGQTPTAVGSGDGASPRSRSRFRPAVWFPIAATLALATAAAVLVRQIDRRPGGAARDAPAAASGVPAAPGPTPVPVTPRGEVPAQPPARPPGAAIPAPAAQADPLATRRGAVRAVNGKTFRMTAGEWIDAAYDPVALLPVRDIVGPDARTALLELIPGLAPYAALGPKVTVAYDGVVYRFRQ